MSATQRPIICHKIVELLNRPTFQKGDRLPSERRMAELFNTSRNTIREALCNLETMGYLEIKEKSGCYLKNKDGQLSWEVLRNRTSQKAKREFLETLTFITPKLAEIGATKLSAKDIQTLESSTAKLGEAIVKFDVSTVTFEYINFFLALAEASQNGYMVLLMKELSCGVQNLKNCGTGLSEVQIDSLFAYHVELFNALKNGNPAEAKLLAEKCMHTFYQLILPDS